MTPPANNFSIRGYTGLLTKHRRQRAQDTKNSVQPVQPPKKNVDYEIKYYVDYTSPPIKPNDLIVDALGGETPFTSLRYFFNYKRIIYNKKGGEKIGVATYEINGNIVEISKDKKSGKIIGDYVAHHMLHINGHSYDIHYVGKLEFILGLRGTQTSINMVNPAENIKNVHFQYASAILIFENNVKINSGDNDTKLVNNGDYSIKWSKLYSKLYNRLTKTG